MSILRVKDELGVWRSIPAIKGDKGDKGDKGEATEAIKDDIIDGDHTWSSSKIDATKLDKAGNASDTTVDFSESAERESLGTGESSSTLFGKIKKWLSDLKAVAFTGSYNDLIDTPASLPADGGNADTVGGITPNEIFVKGWIGEVSNFDDHVTAGIYRVNVVSDPNKHYAMGDYGQLLVLQGTNSDTISQMYFNWDNNDIFVRSGNSTIDWTKWGKINNIFNDGDLQTVKDANDAPIGISNISSGATNNPHRFHSTLMTFRLTDSYIRQMALPWGADEYNEVKYRVKDNNVWLPWTNLNDGGIANAMSQRDERMTNNTPEWYWTNHPKTIINEFKDGRVIGIPGQAYVSVETRTPWVDATGGFPIQIARVNDVELFRYGTSETSWSAWRDTVRTLSNNTLYIKRENDQSANEGGQISLEVGTTATLSGAVNVDTHANMFRIFESGGLYRGVFIDLTTCSQGVTDRILTSKNVATSASAPSSPISGDLWIW